MLLCFVGLNKQRVLTVYLTLIRVCVKDRPLMVTHKKGTLRT